MSSSEYLPSIISPQLTETLRRRTLKEFVYVDEDGKDTGMNVRAKAKDITNLLQDDDRLRRERRAYVRGQTLRSMRTDSNFRFLVEERCEIVCWAISPNPDCRGRTIMEIEAMTMGVENSKLLRRFYIRRTFRLFADACRVMKAFSTAT
jgi:hypothetical protein